MSAAAPLPRAELQCHHCGLPVPAGVDLTVAIDGALRPMCCPGCAAVARTIVEQGLVDYYRHRTTPGTRPEPLVPDALAALRVFDEPAVQAEFVAADPSGQRRATLSVDGMTCAACAWLIEGHLRRIPGVERVSVGLANHRAQIAWDPARVTLSRALEALAGLGYPARPFEPDLEEAREREEERRSLRRLGLAGLGAMQVMMYAVGLYAGALDGMEERYRGLLVWMSWVVATPVVVYAARPFFTGALRDLRARRPGMDVPVALAIGGAYAASSVSTFAGSGPVYFDSVCMFTFFLTLGRHLERRMRRKADTRSRRLLRRAPRTARRIVGSDGAEREERIAARSLRVGDLVRVLAGEIVPADGRVLAGEGPVDESLLTGEPMPRTRRVGDCVIGGSVNVESPIEIEVTRTGPDATLATIVALQDRALAERPAIAETVDRLASAFVTAVVVVAGLTWLYWWQTDPALAFPIALSVLVASCPCALSLATPAALTAANGALAGRGLLILRGHVLGTLARVTEVVFDKTGTLTRGEPELVAIEALGELDIVACVAIAGSLERSSAHPIARVFERWEDDAATRGAPARLAAGVPKADDVRTVTARGVEGRIDGVRYRVGRPDWALELAPGAAAIAPPNEVDPWVLLASERGAEAWFGLRDRLRPGARALVDALRERGLGVTLLTGDPSPGAARVASQLGIDAIGRGLGPDEKRDHVAARQAAGAVVAMVGDGVNDAPVLAQAHVSVAMGGGSDLARVSADSVLLDDRLELLPEAIDRSLQTRRVIRQNIGWALLYNAVVLPLAVTGALAPWAAALGMSASSLVVVGNALRLGDRGGDARAESGTHVALEGAAT